MRGVSVLCHALLLPLLPLLSPLLPLLLPLPSPPPPPPPPLLLLLLLLGGDQAFEAEKADMTTNMSVELETIKEELQARVFFSHLRA